MKSLPSICLSWYSRPHLWATHTLMFLLCCVSLTCKRMILLQLIRNDLLKRSAIKYILIQWLSRTWQIFPSSLTAPIIKSDFWGSKKVTYAHLRYSFQVIQISSFLLHGCLLSLAHFFVIERLWQHEPYCIYKHHVFPWYGLQCLPDRTHGRNTSC